MTFYRDFKNIVISGSAAYERSIVAQLDRVWGTWTGWAVLRAIVDTGNTVRIVPYSAADRKSMGESNAYVIGTSGRDNRPRGARPYAGGMDDPSTPQDERFRRAGFFSLPGTGKGGNAEVHYSPEVFQAALPTCSKTVTSGCLPPMFAQNRGPDDTLVHELVHALRDMRGQSLQIPTRSKEYDNEEEFFAILVQNVYASEKGMTIFRQDHHGHAALPSRLSTSEKFLGKGQRPLTLEELENRFLVSKFVRQNHDVCRSILGRVRAAFNPISEFMLNASQYPADPMLMYPQQRG
jgi:hypothetical protein